MRGGTTNDRERKRENLCDSPGIQGHRRNMPGQKSAVFASGWSMSRVGDTDHQICICNFLSQ
jgi:hypothetical protein